MKRIQPSKTRKTDSPLASMLASRALAAVVICFVLHPDRALHFRALQRVTGVSSRSLQHEVARLESLGLVQRERDGRLVRYRAVAGHPRWSVLRDMVRQFADPAELLRVALADVPGLEAAFIFGSCARGEMDERSDIDVFALGEGLETGETELVLIGGAGETGALLKREVNVARYSPAEFKRRKDTGFFRSVLSGAKIWIAGDEHAFNAAHPGAP